jgi:hypothetical protein
MAASRLHSSCFGQICHSTFEDEIFIQNLDEKIKIRGNLADLGVDGINDLILRKLLLECGLSSDYQLLKDSAPSSYFI